MNVTSTAVRIAALVMWFEIIEHEDGLEKLRSKIVNELWCLRNNVTTVGLEDVTVAEVSTHAIIDSVINEGDRPREEQIAFLLCTLHEVS